MAGGEKGNLVMDEYKPSGETFLAIDPGPKFSGVVAVKDNLNLEIIFANPKADNKMLTIYFEESFGYLFENVVIERMNYQAKRLSKSSIETIEQYGQMIHAANCAGKYTILIERQKVQMFFCGRTNASDAMIRKRVLALYAPTGGGNTPQIGTKRKQGPLYGVTSHAIQALAVGITAVAKFHGCDRIQYFQSIRGEK